MKYYAFVREYPAKTSIKLKIQLPVIYNNAIPIFPFFMSSNPSRLNVENVVKPPKKPTVINNLTIGEIV